ncbi:hypothetical protein KVF89_08305 [Nocardioides carbamazepini]|uniref:hypothetical protein n=1 Tax=Nocardioides carbamazepini TaxID=2854259 RepID=UPI00214A6230|nr:hypothetical protein [Nocardioides carbamazepini]MCR1782532.1 hypothetical protein [Nocardioides carbamazepini]
MPDLAARLRDDLRSALRARDLATVKALRTMLGVIANAEAVPVADPAAGPAGDGPIAGAAAGLGATETARRELTDAEVRSLVADERDDLLAAAEQIDGRAPERAVELRAAADLLASYL